MVSINKYLAIVIVASVLLGVAFGQTEEKPATETATPDAAPQEPGFIGGLGNKLISGLKSAGKAVFSHVPFLNHGAGATSPAVEETTEAAATEAASTDTPATEAPATEAPATEAASSESSANEGAQSAAEQPQAEQPQAEQTQAEQTQAEEQKSV